MKKQFIHLFPILVLLFTTKGLFGQDTLSLQMQVGESLMTGESLGNCFTANSFQVADNLPPEIEIQDLEVTVSNLGQVFAGFTIQVPETTEPGIYEGTLTFQIFTITGSLCFTATVVIIVEVVPALLPEVEFFAFPENVIENGPVSFTNQTINPVSEWLWEFGDGDTSTLKDPTHIYLTPGLYTVNLTAIGPGGTASESKTDYIEVFEAGTPGQVAWTFDLGDVNYSPPAIGSDSTIYINAWDLRLHALRPDGTEKWDFQFPEFCGTVSIGQSGTLYTPNFAFDRIYAIHPNGTEKWIYQDTIDNGNINDRMAVDQDENIYYGTTTGELVSIDSSGSERWRIQLANQYPGVISPVISTTGEILVLANLGGFDTRLYALSPEGSINWEWEQPFFQSASFRSASISKSGLITLTGGSKIAALDTYGNLVWSYPESLNFNLDTRNAGAFDEHDNFYFGGRNGIFYSFSKNGTLNWELDLSGYIPFPNIALEMATPVISSSGIIYCYAKGGVAFAISPAGELIWDLELFPPGFTPNNFIFDDSSIAMGPDGTLYIGYEDGKVHAISTSSIGALEGHWSKEGQNNFNTRSFSCPFPYLRTPIDSAEIELGSAELSWTPVFQADSYEVLISTAPDFSDTAEVAMVTDTSFTISLLDVGTYYWRVRPFLSNQSEGCWSASQTFTLFPPAPSAPVLFTPANGAVGIPLDSTCTWSEPPYATNYRLQIAETNSFTDPEFDLDNIDSLSFNFQLPLAGTTYYWRVKAENGTGESNWSAIWQFTTEMIVGLNELNRPSLFKVFPNPVRGPLFLELQTEQAFEAMIIITNPSGQEVFRTPKSIMPGKQTLEIALPQVLSAGSYTIRLVGGGLDESGKFLLVD